MQGQCRRWYISYVEHCPYGLKVSPSAIFYDPYVDRRHRRPLIMTWQVHLIVRGSHFGNRLHHLWSPWVYLIVWLPDVENPWVYLIIWLPHLENPQVNLIIRWPHLESPRVYLIIRWPNFGSLNRGRWRHRPRIGTVEQPNCKFLKPLRLNVLVFGPSNRDLGPVL